jgi:hypothetical protein
VACRFDREVELSLSCIGSPDSVDREGCGDAVGRP